MVRLSTHQLESTNASRIEEPPEPSDDSNKTVALSGRERLIEFTVIGAHGQFAHNPGPSLGGRTAFTAAFGGKVSGEYEFNPSQSDEILLEKGGRTVGNGYYDGGDGGISKIGDEPFEGHIDGGHGGGASAVVLREKRTGGGFDETPLAIGGGGGGSHGLDNIHPLGGGGGGAPGGAGGESYGLPTSTDGEDAQTTSISWAQNLGGRGASPNPGPISDAEPGGAAVNPIATTTSGPQVAGEQAKVTLTIYGVPKPVTDLTTSLNNSNQPVLSWTAADNGVTQRIFRKEANGQFSQLDTVSSSTGSYTDATTQPLSGYQYKIVQNDKYRQEGNTSFIVTPGSSPVKVYKNGDWVPANTNVL